jgi:tetratricopeptide (TPR) repeat protein
MDASRTGSQPPIGQWREDPRREQRRLPVPADVDVRLLDPDVRRELRSLSKEVADRVAGHLVAAGQSIDDDPAKALAHARAARALAGRVGSVREAAGVAAYRAGEFAEAVAELRTARRITGSAEHLPLLADCERALGRPDRALALARDPGACTLDRATQVELLLVTAGARRDLGQTEAAVVTLQGRELDSDTVQEWTPRLWYAYADALLAAGRVDEARTWFAAVVSIDDAEATDAGERLAALAGR